MMKALNAALAANEPLVALVVRILGLLLLALILRQLHAIHGSMHYVDLSELEANVKAIAVKQEAIKESEYKQQGCTGWLCQ